MVVCGKAELWLSVGFPLFNTLFQKFARISPEFHRNSPEFTRISPEFHRNFARISDWSTSKKGITTTRPSHMVVPSVLAVLAVLSSRHFVRSFALVLAEASPSGGGACATGVAGVGYLQSIFKFNLCFCGLDHGNLKFETVRTHKQHICF